MDNNNTPWLATNLNHLFFMKIFLMFLLSLSFIDCKGQNKISVYLSHCDSLFYIQGERFDVQKITKGKMNDSAFINELFSSISPATHKILFKPYTDICINGNGMNAVITPWKTFFSRRGFNYEMASTNSAEDKYFGGQSIYGYTKESAEAKKKPSRNDGMPPPPLPPPPIEVIITEDGKPRKGDHKYAVFVKAKDAVTFLLPGKGFIYYYEGKFIGKLHKTNMNAIGELIKQYKAKTGTTRLMFIIKTGKASSSVNVYDLLDKIHPAHFTATDITNKEIQSINNFKEN